MLETPGGGCSVGGEVTAFVEKPLGDMSERCFCRPVTFAYWFTFKMVVAWTCREMVKKLF